MNATEFSQASSRLAGRMVSLDAAERAAAATEAAALMDNLPTQIANERSLRGEFKALRELIARVQG